MKLHRFLYQNISPKEDFAISDSQLIHQIHTVLRMEVGGSFIVFNGTGFDTTVVIQTISKKELIVSPKETIPNIYEPIFETTLYMALLKKENTDLLIQKATELGCTTITPIITARTIKTGFNMDRALRIVLEATEQSGRDKVPTLTEPMSFEQALLEKKESVCILFDPKGKPYSFNGVKESVGIFIGPEGGFTDEEITLAQKHGTHIVSLETPILRGETAGIVGVYKAVRRL
jgi:16S rRNA (uracil1498-N3)-methyltransferase